MNDRHLEQLCKRANEFYERGDAFGGSGNLSLRKGENVFITPTATALKDLQPASLARITLSGASEGDVRPSKEYPFHLAIYRNRPDMAAVVHLHSPNTVAVSCLRDLNASEPLPALTPYYIMRVAPLGVVDYFRPGSDELAAAVGETAKEFDCMLLRNHGLICAGSSFGEAADRAIELEETCRLFLTLQHHSIRTLTPKEINDLTSTFPPKN